YVQSAPDKGSTFSFTLPVAEKINDTPISKQEIATSEEPLVIASLHESNNEKTKKSAKILVVDDDPINLRIIKKILHFDYEVGMASCGDEALTLIETGKWDLVIADVMMPNMSGYELTKKIREQFTISELPILL